MSKPPSDLDVDGGSAGAAGSAPNPAAARVTKARVAIAFFMGGGLQNEDGCRLLLRHLSAARQRSARPCGRSCPIPAELRDASTELVSSGLLAQHCEPAQQRRHAPRLQDPFPVTVAEALATHAAGEHRTDLAKSRPAYGFVIGEHARGGRRLVVGIGPPPIASPT